MNWKQAELEDVLKWSQSKEVIDRKVVALPTHAGRPCYGVRLSDGSEVVAESSSTFWIGVPNATNERAAIQDRRPS
jgi:hypothetical protein